MLVASRPIADNARIFAPLLPPAWMQPLHGNIRHRHFDPSATFWAWTDQILDGNASCSKAVSRVQAWCVEKRRPVPSGATGAYCMARQRLDDGFLHSLHERITRTVTRRHRTADLWHGMAVKSIDGSSVQLMDTSDNQASFPQSSGQKPGCGFPIMAIAGVLDLSSGCWLGMASAPAHTHDTRLAARLLQHFGQGDLALADRAFNSYELVASLGQRGAHSLMRLHAARHRTLDWRKGRKIGPNERLVEWRKPAARPTGSPLDDAQWQALPDILTLRLIRFHYENRAGEKARMVLVTTLTDPATHDWVELADLYARRWDIELKLRDLKTTLRLERFEVRPPGMARKTLLMVMIAHNLIRGMLQSAAIGEGLPVEALSFKGGLDLLLVWKDQGYREGATLRIARDNTIFDEFRAIDFRDVIGHAKKPSEK
ncbi:IS4 family transposase [Luteolibacter sp. LG18]|uniref:IS4 family transposase n=1 Tax=Luteolibacter sp. LG18 TaxID=2819286 RepID=UPI002B30561C|nr:hypothetical protein llg_33870 [Luteolibacter sp. LG18]